MKKRLAALVAAGLLVTACGSRSGEARTTPCADSAGSTSASAEAMPGTIVDLASTTEGFATLVAAVTAAGLVETLLGVGPLTVFAPTDAASAALPAGLLDKLLLPKNKPCLPRS